MMFCHVGDKKELEASASSIANIITESALFTLESKQLTVWLNHYHYTISIFAALNAKQTQF